MKHPREWDAGIYHQVSAPQRSWGLRVLERLELKGGEWVLDAGCGTGRVTLTLVERVRERGGHVVAMDRSVEMARTARGTLPADVPLAAAHPVAMPVRRVLDRLFRTP